MEPSLVLFFLLAGALTALIPATLARDFYVGDGSGWTQSPPKNYINWAEGNRFQVNDTLVFKYKKAEDSVLVVNKTDCDACNTNTPLQRLQGDDDSASFRFDRSGAFYFISGAAGHCQKGQKMIVIVLAVRGNDTPNPTPASPPHPPALSSPSPSPYSLISPSPSPKPVLISSPSPSPAPSTLSSPSPSPKPVPISSPSPSPAPSTLSSPSPSPAAATAGVSPTSQPPESTSSPPSGTPVSSSTPASAPSPPPSTNSKKSSSSVLAASAASFGLAALFSSAALF